MCFSKRCDGPGLKGRGGGVTRVTALALDGFGNLIAFQEVFRLLMAGIAPQATYPLEEFQDPPFNRFREKIASTGASGAQYLTRSMTSKKFMRATRPTCICAIAKTQII